MAQALIWQNVKRWFLLCARGSTEYRTRAPANPQILWLFVVWPNQSLSHSPKLADFLILFVLWPTLARIASIIQIKSHTLLKFDWLKINKECIICLKFIIQFLPIPLHCVQLIWFISTRNCRKVRIQTGIRGCLMETQTMFP